MSVRNTFPQQRPTLNLDFSNSKTLDPRITFTRTSTATYVDEDGLIKSVDADVARFDHDPVTGECLGLLVEEQRTNLTENSETLSDYSNQRVSNNTISTGGPFGTGYHEKTITDTGSNYNFHFNNQISITAGQTITFSIFLRNVDITNNQFYLRFWTGTGRAWTTQRQVRYNLTNLTTSVSSGTIVNSSIQPFPDDWYRLSMTATADQDGFAAESFYTSSNSVGEKYQLMGAQVEVGAFPTSYIPTSGGTATRNPDNVSMTGDNFSDWYNQSEGTFEVSLIENGLGKIGGYPGVMYVDDGTGQNCIGFYISDAGDDGLRFEIYDGNVGQGNTPTIGVVSVGEKYNVIGAYASNDMVSTGGGLSVVNPDTSVVLPDVNRLIIGILRGGQLNNMLNGTISKLTYYPTRLSNDQLQNLTK